MHEWSDDPRPGAVRVGEDAGLTTWRLADGTLAVLVAATDDDRTALVAARSLLDLVAGRHLGRATAWYAGDGWVGWGREGLPTAAERLGAGAAFTAQEAARLGSQVSLALSTVHAAGLVHGAVGPATVGLGPAGAVLLDLAGGVVRAGEDDLAGVVALVRALTGGVPGPLGDVLTAADAGRLTVRQLAAQLAAAGRHAALPSSAPQPDRERLPRSPLPALGTLFPPQPVVELAASAAGAAHADDLPALVDADDLDGEATRRAAALDLDAIAYSASIHPAWAAAQAGGAVAPDEQATPDEQTTPDVPLRGSADEDGPAAAPVPWYRRVPEKVRAEQ